MNETVTAFLKDSHNLVRTGMYSFLFVRLGIMSPGPDRTFQGAVSGPQAVVCPCILLPLFWHVGDFMQLEEQWDITDTFISGAPCRLSTAQRWAEKNITV